MKNYLLIFLTLASLPVFGQKGYFIGEITRKWTPKHIQVKDGLVHKYKLYDGYDTAYRYIIGPDKDTFEVEIRFKKITQVPKPDLVLEVDDQNYNIVKYFLCSNPTSCTTAPNLGQNVFSLTNWSHMYDKNWNQLHYGKTISLLYVGGHVEAKAVCTKIQFWGERAVNHGIIAISIDGGPEIKKSMYALTSENNSQLVWESNDLPKGEHIIKARYTGEKETAATEFNINVDKFVFITKEE